MILIKQFTRAAVIALLSVMAAVTVFAQKEAVGDGGKPLLWEAVKIGERDLYLGPGGAAMQPDLTRLDFVGKQDGGTSMKYRVKDAAGREWVIKIGRETQPETAAVRLLWALGYKTEVNYIVPKVELKSMGYYKNVRFEARPDNVKRLDRWSWANNPFNGTNELEGLKIMMAMFNNWDIKDENTAIIKDGDAQYYIISDLGATFGKLPDVDGEKSGRSVNKPDQYAQSKFIKQVRDGAVEIEYRARPQSLIKTFKIENGRWLADLLLQLSDKQIEDAFRAANYEPDEIKLLAQAFKSRIAELDAATKSPTATTVTNQ